MPCTSYICNGIIPTFLDWNSNGILHWKTNLKQNKGNRFHSMDEENGRRTQSIERYDCILNTIFARCTSGWAFIGDVGGLFSSMKNVWRWKEKKGAGKLENKGINSHKKNYNNRKKCMQALWARRKGRFSARTFRLRFDLLSVYFRHAEIMWNKSLSSGVCQWSRWDGSANAAVDVLQ